MILQALTEYYESLVSNHELPAYGLEKRKVSYALVLREDGTPVRLLPLETPSLHGKKEVLAPREIIAPMSVKRSSGTLPNFLCDNSSYILGLYPLSPETPKREEKEKNKALDHFQACKEYHLQMLSHISTAFSSSVKNYFLNWNPEDLVRYPFLLTERENLLEAKGNIIFLTDDKDPTGNISAFGDDETKKVWIDHFSDEEETSSENLCLITGQHAETARIHPAIKGIRGAQSSGAALVSYNAPAFCSYDKEQNLNAPIGRYAAYAYTSSLNYLINKTDPPYIGDTAVLCWSKNGSSAYRNCMINVLFPNNKKYSDSELRNAVSALANGHPIDWEEETLYSEEEFYILGLSPNAARLAVRFFYQDSFGTLMKNVQRHYERLRIEKPAYDLKEFLSVWMILMETVNQKSKDKKASPELAGSLLKAIITDGRYPSTLINGVTQRIRADHDINRTRAAIIKAYYLKNKNVECPEEVLQVGLNEQTKNTSYVLGRLFSVLEEIQENASPGLNATIKDKYFNSASATPATVFPLLINLSEKHLKKLNTAEKRGIKISLEKKMGDLMGKLNDQFPTQLTLPQQGSFQLGYYHERQRRYQKKDSSKEN